LDSPLSDAGTAPPPTKRLKPDEDSFFGDLFDPPTQVSTDELDAYMSCTDQNADILGFWSQKRDDWPKLSTVARTVLAIPATETSSERVFSLAGRTLEERRTQLSVDSVDDLLFIHGLEKLC
jgi:hypothetical protein